MWTDIFIKNKKYLLKTLELFLKDIEVIKGALKIKVEEIFNLLKEQKDKKNVLEKGIK